MRRNEPRPVSSALIAMLVAMFVAMALAAGCTSDADEPVRDSREALGTVVTVTAYGGGSKAAEQAVDAAYEAIAEVEEVLSAYPDVAAGNTAPEKPVPHEVTSVAEFNRDPFEWHVLPPAVARVFDRVARLGVSEYFSPGMLRVIGLYDFEGTFEGVGEVPDAAELGRMVRAAQALETTGGATSARFTVVDGIIVAPPGPPSSSYAPPAAGLDLSGAAKGDALDAALGVIEKAIARGDLSGALISAGSTTVVTGTKSDPGETWQIGIEDPRDPERVIGIVQYSLGGGPSGGGGTVGLVSTSGDYQQYFIRDGVRYHHILNPATGEPARGMRSLTVVGGSSGLDSDILSTALFVMGIDKAAAYARAHGLGLFIVDDEGRTHIVPGPEGAPFSISASEE